MRIVPLIGALVALSVCASAADAPASSGQSVCPPMAMGSVAPSPMNPCGLSKKDLKEAQSAFNRGVKYKDSGHLPEAFDEFERAAKLNPANVNYLTAREYTREQIVFNHIQEGNREMTKGQTVEAMANFRDALQLDPQNQFAAERLHESLQEWEPEKQLKPLVVASSEEIKVNPKAEHADFHYRGDSRALFEQIGKIFGVQVLLDQSVASKRVRFDVEDVGFFKAMQLANDVSKTFWAPVTSNQVIVAQDTPENHRQYDRMVMRTFYVPDASTPQELNELVNAMRLLFEMRFINPQPNRSTIVVRAPQDMLDAATTFLEKLDQSRPQVLLDVKIYEIDHTYMRSFGLDLPAQFTMFNIPAGALAALGGQSIQDLINQLISGGGINQANTTSIAALLAQLQTQQNSIFARPFATFGGGLTFMAVAFPTIAAHAGLNESSVKTLDHATLRAGQGADATFRVGTRFPILNASFAPIFNSPAISKVLQNQSFTPAFPSFNYEDLGLTIKAKPQVHNSGDVSLDLQIQIRSLGAQSLNGVPIINNREYKGMITLRDGEPGVVAGIVSQSEQNTLSGIPGFAQIPGIKQVTGFNGINNDDNELLVVIT
ncbi:MAG TPA: hypothetical protein VE994_00615, partial [Terriglobales bacterium]|nr:hypothetical protein [Terriglobales bacterium]